MKSLRGTTAVLLVVLLAAVQTGAQGATPEVVMTVNEEPVYSWEMSVIMPQIQAQMARAGQNPTQESVSQAAVQQIVQVRLIAQEARRREFTVDEALVDQAMNQIVQQAGGEEALGTILGQFGVGIPDLKKNVRESVVVQAFVENQIAPEVTVSAEEIEAFYNENPAMFQQPDQVHARHILFTVEEAASDDEKKAASDKAEAARKRAVSGEDFAELAKELSQGPSAPSGGDLGFFARDRMVKPFADAAFALDVGEISEVVLTQFGYHIIKVEEKREASTMTLEESREPVGQMLRERKAGEKMSALVNQLFEDAAIVQKQPAASTGTGSVGGAE